MRDLSITGEHDLREGMRSRRSLILMAMRANRMIYHVLIVAYHMDPEMS